MENTERERCFGMRSVLNREPHCQVLTKQQDCNTCRFYKPASQVNLKKIDEDVLLYTGKHPDKK